MNEYSDGSEKLQKQWVERITDYIWGSQSNSSLRVIRSWDFILAFDGSIESLPVSQIEGESHGMYSTHYCIPSTSIDSLERQEQINRQGHFAFVTLIYEIDSSKKPFGWLNNEEMQRWRVLKRCQNSPTSSLHCHPVIWSPDFADISVLLPLSIFSNL